MSGVSEGAALAPNSRTLIVSAVAIAVTAISITTTSGISGLLGAGLGLIMVAIADKDAREQIIPDELNAAGFALGVLHAVLVVVPTDLSSGAVPALRAVVTAGSFWLIREVYKRARERHGLGLGDVKLAAVAGIWLDWLTIVIVIELAAVSAIAYYACMRLQARHVQPATIELPFGLFLAPSIWLGWVSQNLF